jgi:hypothetical protein
LMQRNGIFQVGGDVCGQRHRPRETDSDKLCNRAVRPRLRTAECQKNSYRSA